MVVTNLTPVVATEASWNDEEWDHAAIGTLSCADDGIFKTRGSGQLLSGGLLPLDLDQVAGVSPMTVTHDGDQAHPRPATATANQAGDSYTNPIDVGLLSAINLPLTGGSLDDLLSLPLATEVGAVNQYALADGSGVSQGASGVVNDSGVVQTDNDDNGNLPTLGTLELSTLVESLTGEAVSGLVASIADLDLEIGAVASRATLDACDAAWSNDVDSSLDREYAIAGLAAAVDAPLLVGELAKDLRDILMPAVSNLQSQLNTIAGQGGVLTGITGGLGDLLGGVLGGLGLGNVGLDDISITVDLISVVEPLLHATIEDQAGIVAIDLQAGSIRVDLGALLGEAYSGDRFDGAPGSGLNGLAPNTELVVNAQVTSALITALTNAIDDWVATISSSLTDAILEADVHASISLELRALIKLAGVSVKVDGTLDELLHGDAVVVPKVDIIVGCPLNLLSCLIEGVVSSLVGGVGELVGDTLRLVILDENTGLVPNLVSTLIGTARAALIPAIEALETVLVGFLGVNGLVSLRANVQNDPGAGRHPDPDPALTYPDWEDGSIPDGQYDVAALSVGVLNVLGTTANINLELARSSVGVSCAVDGVLDREGRCANY
nr:choice-of-anchor G family protein [Microbacterium ginsengiterrae]